MRGALFIVVTAIFWCFAQPSHAAEPVAPDATAAAAPTTIDTPGLAAWIERQLRRYGAADVAQFPGCEKQLGDADHQPWPCPLDPGVFVDMLDKLGSDPGFTKHQVNVRAAYFSGPFDLSNREIKFPVQFSDVYVAGDLILRETIFDHGFQCSACDLAGKLDTYDMTSVGSFAFNQSGANEIDMVNAVVHGDLDFREVGTNELNINNLRLDDDLRLEDPKGEKSRTHIGSMNIFDSNIGGNLMMAADPADFDNDQNATDFDKVIIQRNHVGGMLSGNAIRIQLIDLSRTVVDRDINFVHAQIDLGLWGSDLSVGGTVFLRDATIGGVIQFNDAKLAKGITLQNATVSQIDLTESDLEEILLAGTHWACPDTDPPRPKPKLVPISVWSLGGGGAGSYTCDDGKRDDESLPYLNFRGAHMAVFPAYPRSWPPRIDMRGFSFDHLGGSHEPQDGTRPETSVKEWLNLLARDPNQRAALHGSCQRAGGGRAARGRE